MVRLIAPHPDYATAFAAFYADFAQNDPENAGYYQAGVRDFVSYVQQLSAEAQGLQLLPEHVPCHHFWLVNKQQDILGAVRVRHHLGNAFLAWEGGHIGYDIAPRFRGMGHGKTLLKLALIQAQALGIPKVLLVANADNWASRKIIEANAGVLEGLVMGNVIAEALARYWIVLDQEAIQP